MGATCYGWCKEGCQCYQNPSMDKVKNTQETEGKEMKGLQYYCIFLVDNHIRYQLTYLSTSVIISYPE